MPDVEHTDSPPPFDFSTWLSHFMLYLGVVSVTITIGIYFLYKIPIFQDLSQVFKNISSVTQSRPRPTLTPMVAPTPGAATEQSGIASRSVPIVTTVQPAPALPSEIVTPPPPENIDQLLAEAQGHFDNRKFTAPAGANALSTYQRILAIQPDHPGALEGIQRIAAYYRDTAQRSVQQGRLDESLTQINRGLRVAPQHAGLLELRQTVQQAKRRQQRELAAQAASEREVAASQTPTPRAEPASEKVRPIPARTRIEQVEQPRKERPAEEPTPWWGQPAGTPQHADSWFNNQR